MNIVVLRYDTLDSTNTAAAAQARQGADEGLCIIARQQTAGRGRHGRRWVSEPDAGLYFSIVLRPSMEPRSLPLVTLMAGVAVHDTLHEYGLRPDIKWVNDVLVNEKKISGILAEAVETPKGLAVILGIGINVTSGSLRPEISATATSLERELGDKPPIDTLAEQLTRYLGYFYEMLGEPDGPRDILTNWRQRSSYFSGKSVRVTMPDGDIEGTTDGLEPNGALRVKRPDGSVAIIQAGDVQQLRSRTGQAAGD